MKTKTGLLALGSILFGAGLGMLVPYQNKVFAIVILILGISIQIYSVGDEKEEEKS